MNIHYLEVVTTDVDAMCALYTTLHGAAFGDAVPTLGGARTATLSGGTIIGVRGQMRPTEEPVIRSYARVDDIQDAVDEAAALGAQVAVPPMELPGHGMCAIVLRGGIEVGFWQV